MIKIPIAEPKFTETEFRYVQEAIESGWISSKGDFIQKFENEFSKYCNSKFGISTSNGTTALHLALKAIEIGKGDQVIIPSLTFIATANVVRYCNAKPVFVDSHPDYWCIDPLKIEEKITYKTKAIIPVHLYGHPCDMDVIIDIAEDHDLYVIEDAAEAHGAEYKGKKVGGIGHIGCFSFFGNKIITTGEGGMCTTNNEELQEKMIILKNHGMNPERRYWHDVIGYNYRMTNIQAAIGLAQLEKIEDFISIKRKNAKLYNSFLHKIDGIILPPEMEWAKNVYWMYSFLIKAINERKRNDIMKKLFDKGIDSRPFFYPIHTMPMYKFLSKDSLLSVSEKLSKTGINLPSGVNLKDEEIIFISKTLKEFFQ